MVVLLLVPGGFSEYCSFDLVWLWALLHAGGIIWLIPLLLPMVCSLHLPSPY